MKALFAVLALASGISTSHGQQDRGEALARRVDSMLVGAADEADYSDLDEKDRAWVIARLRSVADDPEAAYSRSATAILVATGDPRELQRQADAMRDGRSILITWMGKEEAVEYLMPLVRGGSTVEKLEVEGKCAVVSASVRDRAISCIFQILGRSGKFPAATKQWAGRDSWTGGEAEKHLLEWYARNETAIRGRRYAEATWLPAE